MSRVGIVYRLDRMGGIQSCIFSLIKGLNQHGIVPVILWDVEPKWSLLDNLSLQAQFRFVKFPISTLFIDKLPDSLRYLAHIANAIDGDQFEADFDFFYIFYNGFLLWNNTPNLRYTPRPSELSSSEKLPSGFRSIPLQIFQSLYKYWWKRDRPVFELHPNGCYVTISQYTASLFQNAYGIALPIVPPPVDLSTRRFDPTDLGGRDTITFFSRLVDYKRPAMVIDLARCYPNLRCVLMGGVPPNRNSNFRSLQSRAEEMELKNVVILANPAEERVREELARTRFYVFPAKDEHFGMTTVEAIASGAIPYVHDSGGSREIVPFEEMRFEDDAFLTKFDILFHTPVHELGYRRQALYDHIQQYSEDAYINKMLAFLPIQ